MKKLNKSLEIRRLLKIELSTRSEEIERGVKIVYWTLPNGNYHRDFGPAIERSNGFKVWYQNGFRHREDGPAIFYSKGDYDYCINGVIVSFNEFMEFRKQKKGHE